MGQPVVPLASLALAFVFSAAPAHGVLITFEQLPDGTPIQNQPGCGEVTFESFRPWGVLFTPADGAELNIGQTWPCLSGENRLERCPQTGTLNITFVAPTTNVATWAVDRVRFAVLTQTTPVSNNRVNTYNAQGELLHTWVMGPGFCEKPPLYVDDYDFSAPGQIARVQCILVRAGIDDVVVEGGTIPVEGATWGGIKSFYR